MLAGHMLILTFIGLIFVLENVFLAVIAVPAATLFYLFEVVIVVSIQAYIFAALSAIYIGSAIEPEHHQGGCKRHVFDHAPRRDHRRRRRRRQGDRARARHRPRLARGRHRHREHLRLDDPGRRRQPELRGELTGIQWLGFALTEAVVFYGLIGGLLAYVLV